MSVDDTPQIKRAKLAKMSDDEISNLIEKNYSKCYTTEDTFIEICKNFGFYPMPNRKMLANLAKGVVTNDSDIKNCFQKEYIELMSKIVKHYQRFQKQVYTGYIGYDHVLNGSNPRYTLQLNSADNPYSIELFDSFHGKKRTFPIIKKKFDSLKMYDKNMNFYPISSNQILLIFNPKSKVVNKIEICLLELDVEKKKCQVLDHCTIPFYNARPVIDKNELLFIVEKNENYDYNYIPAQLKDDKILIYQDKLTLIDIPFVLEDEILTNAALYLDHKLCFIFNNVDALYNQDITVSYREIDTKNNGNVTNSFDFKIDNESVEYDNWNGVQDGYFAWTKHKVCYVYVDYNQSYFSYLYAFDVNAQKCDLINLACQDVRMLRVNENDELVVKTSDESIFQYSLRKPDSLQNLVWFKIRQTTIKSGRNDLHKKALRVLPLISKLQPFKL